MQTQSDYIGPWDGEHTYLARLRRDYIEAGLRLANALVDEYERDALARYLMEFHEARAVYFLTAKKDALTAFETPQVDPGRQ